MAYMAPIHKLLTRNRRTALALFGRLIKVKGIPCDIYFPIVNTSIFGLEDSLVAYPTVPTKTGEKLLVFNIFQEAYVGNDGFDPFIQESYVLTTFTEKLPLQTKIVISFLGRDLIMKVDDHKNLVPSVEDQLFVKNTLAAIA